MFTVDKLLFILNKKIDYYEQYNWLPDTERGMYTAFKHCKEYIEFLNNLDNDNPLPSLDSDKMFALKSDILFRCQYYSSQDDINDFDFGIVLGMNKCFSLIIKLNL